ncbi:MAG: putative Ig domain-containing protein [Verrucomicrobia bacterium]|nr:putative Ig domain-containing protein [Verrucomicrobiota bacterium]
MAAAKRVFVHADWAEAKFEATAGAVLATSKAPPPGLLTPPVPATPRINGARVVGVRPGKPCLYTIAASGERPLRFAANNLPQGLKLDPQTGRLTGSVAKAGTYPIDDKWDTVARCGFELAGPAQAAGPGHWNDPDMMVLGHVGWGANHWPTNLKPDEQLTHLSLWCLLASPLLLGCDLTELDEFTLSLLTNDEVIEVNQDPLGRQAARVAKDGDLEVWAKEMEDGSRAVGLFNRGRRPAAVTALWKDLGITGPQQVRDLWRQQDLTVAKDACRAEVPGHGCVLLRIGGKQTR